MDEKLLTELMEPIWIGNIDELVPGEWIWDTRLTERREHNRSFHPDIITEETGFRQIDILNKDAEIHIGQKPFMLTDIKDGCSKWEYLEYGRFYKFKKRGGSR